MNFLSSEDILSTKFLNTIFEGGLWYFLLTGVILVFGVFMIMYFVKLGFLKFTRDHDYKKSLTYKLIKIVLISLAVYTMFNKILPLKSLTTALLAGASVAVVAFSLLAQEAVGNLIAGVVISVFKPFVVNDIVTVDGANISGTVTDISLRHTTVKTLQNTSVIVPNSIMNSAVIENKKVKDYKLCNYLFVSVSYDADLDKVRKILAKIVSNHPLNKDVRTKSEINDGVSEVAIHFTEFGSSGIEVRACIWTKGPAEGFQALSDCREAIKKEFDKAKIHIPYQTIEVKNGK